jgi:hypothetical protein
MFVVALPYLLAGFIGIGLVKVGMLSVWVSVLALSLKLAIAVIVVLSGLLAWKHVKNQ